MTETINLHGWTDLILPTEAMLTLSSRAFKLLGYYLFRARSTGSCVPGIRRIGEDLKTEDEKWSDSTIKRTNEELSDKGWIVRVRSGVGKNSETHVFRTSQDKVDWEARQLTDDPSVSSQVSRPLAHRWTDSKNTQNKDHSDKDSAKPVKTEQSSRPRNLVFDIVATRGFGIMNLNAITDGGRIAKVSTWIKKNNPSVTPEQVTAFYDWWDQEHDGISAPRDLVKFQEHWTSFEHRKAQPQNDPFLNRTRIQAHG